MTKITFLMLHLNYGGLEKQTITLINELAKKNKYDISIVSVYDLLNGKSFYEIDKSVKLRFLYKSGPNHKKIYELKKDKKYIKLLKEYYIGIKGLYYKNNKLKNVIKSLDTDVIISTRIEFSKMIKRRDTINISCEHSYIDNDKYIDKIRKCFKNINYIVVLTNKAKEKYESWLKGYNNYSNVIMIPNIVEIDNGLTSNLNSNEIISIGRLEEEKDFTSLIEVMKIIDEKDSSIKLKIIGDGRQKEKLINLVKDLKIENKVKFLGLKEFQEIKQELLNSNLFVLTSKCESFSLVIIEAMNYGVPCISFDIDVGPKEIIKNDYNGYLIENRDKLAMANKIIEVINNKDRLKELSLGALETSKLYKSDVILPKWEEILGD